MRGLPQTLIGFACNWNMLSLSCGEETGKWAEAEPDRTAFVWRKEARLLAMHIPKDETHTFCQRFLEAKVGLV